VIRRRPHAVNIATVDIRRDGRAHLHCFCRPWLCLWRHKSRSRLTCPGRRRVLPRPSPLSTLLSSLDGRKSAPGAIGGRARYERATPRSLAAGPRSKAPSGSQMWYEKSPRRPAAPPGIDRLPIPGLAHNPQNRVFFDAPTQLLRKARVTPRTKSLTRYGRPPDSPTSWTETMDGCRSWARFG
jgi:hypothetical protein